MRLVRSFGTLFNLACNDSLLVHVMTVYGLRTVLCAGNGTSHEARALAAAGFDVTALDISSVAVKFAEADAKPLRSWVPSQLYRPGGRLTFVVGDLLDPGVCPGLFDVVIERRTVERFGEYERSPALAALSGRLGQVGIFLSMCFDDNFPLDLGWSQHESGFFHASESWFREHEWTIWDDVPRAPLAGRVAWLVRTGSPKRRPENRPPTSVA
jgi:SAM-dependent methyltransferase